MEPRETEIDRGSWYSSMRLDKIDSSQDVMAKFHTLVNEVGGTGCTWAKGNEIVVVLLREESESEGKRGLKDFRGWKRYRVILKKYRKHAS